MLLSKLKDSNEHSAIKNKIALNLKNYDSYGVEHMKDVNPQKATKSMNNLPVDIDELTDLIMKKVRESESNARSGFALNLSKRGSKYRPYPNN